MTRVADQPNAHDRDLRGMTREMLDQSTVVMLLRHRAEMLLMLRGEFVSAGQLTKRLVQAHAEGSVVWCPPSWSTTMPDPYPGGVGQHLAALRGTYYMLETGKDVSENGSTTLYRLTKKAHSKFAVWREEQEELKALLFACECGEPKDSHAAIACLACRQAKAPLLLPPEQPFQMIARTYEARTGCPVLFGVTDDLVRVIRVRTLRGDLDHELAEDMSWDEAVAEWLT